MGRSARTRDDGSAQAKDLIDGWDGAVKVPVFVQGNIHGGEREGMDALMQVIRDLATTPRGEHPDVDNVLDHDILVFIPTINPEGRIAGTRQNLNNFDLNRDYLTQSQDEVKASVSFINEWLPATLLDLHGYYQPTLTDGTTIPHNPGIEFDLYQPWNIERIAAQKDALAAAGYSVQIPVFQFCPGGGLANPNCPGDVPPDPQTAEGWDDWGPFYTQVYGELAGAMDSSTIEMCSTSCGGRIGSKTVQYVSVWSTMVHAADNAGAMLSDQMEGYRRGVEGEARADCCEPPFGPIHNWMTPYPLAHVIPFGAGQRSDAEANRLVDWLLFNDIEVTKATKKFSFGGTKYAKGSYVVWMDQARRGFADTALSVGDEDSPIASRSCMPLLRRGATGPCGEPRPWRSLPAVRSSSRRSCRSARPTR